MVAVLWLLSRRSSASFEAETVAVLRSRPQSAASVNPVTWIWKPVLAAIESQWHVSVPLVIEQKSESSLQVMPAGSGSLRLTSLAVPGPRLDTVMSNSAVSPALIGSCLAVLTTETSGQSTAIWTGPAELLDESTSTSDETVAVLLIDGHAPVPAVPVRVTCFSAPGAMAPKLQWSTPLVIVQEPPSVPPGAFQATPLGSASLTVTLVELPVPPAATVMV